MLVTEVKLKNTQTKKKRHNFLGNLQIAFYTNKNKIQKHTKTKNQSKNTKPQNLAQKWDY